MPAPCFGLAYLFKFWIRLPVVLGCLSSRCLQPFCGTTYMIEVSFSDCRLCWGALAADACSLFGTACMIDVSVSDCMLCWGALAADACTLIWQESSTACMIEVSVCDCMLRWGALAADACALSLCGLHDVALGLRLYTTCFRGVP
jgi:hypothetical protein